jgi:hypothetical protein
MDQSEHLGANVVRITDETLPILCFQCYGKSTQADIDFVRPYYQRAVRSGKFIGLSDARYGSNDADQRRMWARWLAEFNQIDAHGRCVATVLMLDSPILRGALIALNWITPSRAPQRVVGSNEEALEECRLLATRHGLDTPAHLWGHVRLWLDEGSQHSARK